MLKHLPKQVLAQGLNSSVKTICRLQCWIVMFVAGPRKAHQPKRAWHMSGQAKWPCEVQCDLNKYAHMAALTLTKRPSKLQCNALSCLWVLQLVIAWWLTEKRCAPACCDRSALCQNSFLAARSWLQTRLTNFQNQDNKKRANCRIGSDTTFRTLFSVHKPLWLTQRKHVDKSMSNRS